MTAHALFDQADARIAPETAEEAASRLFGMAGRAAPLIGERDHNFVLTATSGRRFVLKFSHSAEDEAVTDLQNGILEHLSVASDVPTPRMVAGRDGALRQTWLGPKGRPRTVRLLTFLPGVPLSEVDADRPSLQAVGAALARFDRALRDFTHPADRHELLWDLSRAAQSRAFAASIGTKRARTLAERGLDLFENQALPALPSLRSQVIHNDLNPFNVLVDVKRAETTGILDMGDAVRGPLINDVAIAAAYHVRHDGDALSGAAAVVRGYAGVLPLEEAEVALIPALIAGRLAMTLAITAWRARRHPKNRTYILRNAPAALTGLARLLEGSADGGHARFRRAAGFST